MIDSIDSSFSVSPCSRRPAGIPVQAEMTSAMSSAPTRSFTMGSLGAPPSPAPRAASASLAAASWSSSSRISPYSIRLAVSKS